MAFSINKRSRQQPEIAKPEIAIADAPEQRLADAEAAIDALLGEQAAVRATLADHQQQRQEILSDDGDLAQIVDLDRADYQLKLRDEQIARRLPALQTAVQEARADVHELAWRDYRPALVQAEQHLVAAIGALYRALAQVQNAHGEAHRLGFGGRLGEFLKPPPGRVTGSVISDFALREFVKFAERKVAPMALPLMDNFAVSLDEAPIAIPPAQRFVPRRVPIAEIEQISPIAPARFVRILFGPVRTVDLNVGVSRMFPGEEHMVSARAGHALVASGLGEYADGDDAATAAAD